MTNADLASRALALADDDPAARKIALCAYVALSTTKTTAAARKALREWGGPSGISARAVELLDQLAGR